MELLAPVRNLHLLYIHNTKITIVASSEKKNAEACQASQVMEAKRS
jgi:hypothetical protein